MRRTGSIPGWTDGSTRTTCCSWTRPTAPPSSSWRAHAPDVILAGSHYGIDEDHETLATIAPVVTTVDGLNEDTWQDQARLIGESLGLEQAAHDAVADVEDRIEQTRTVHPQWGGPTFVTAFGHEAGVVPIGAGDSFGPRFPESIGLQLSPAVADLPSPDTRLEQPELLDADLLLVSCASPDLRTDLEASALFAELPVVREGRYAPIDVVLSAALTAECAAGRLRARPAGARAGATALADR